MNFRALIGAVVVALAVSFSTASHAQGIVSEDFTGTQTKANWFFFNGACLTAGTSTSLSSPGPVPACTTVLNGYYRTVTSSKSSLDGAMTGGYAGFLGSSTAPSSPTAQVPDPDGNGALRFTNGYPYGGNENGAIVSASTPFPTGAGVQITFKTVTYLGNSGGGGGDGADGVSFYLLDGCMPINGGSVPGYCQANAIYGSGKTFPAIGAFGGSLAYTCSNNNSPYDGLVGAYLGLGIDEYGNFLNGTTNTLGETGSTNPGPDNTASGGLYQPGRIGLRGAGSISWQALNTAYGANPGDSTKPYYPSTLATSCSSGTYNAGACQSCGTGTSYYAPLNQCSSCSAGTYISTTNSCSTCSVGAYYAGTNSCSTCSVGAYYAGTNTCSTCSVGNYVSGSNTCAVCTTGTYVAGSGCASCQSGWTYDPTANQCNKTGRTSKAPNYATPTSNPVTANLVISTPATANAAVPTQPTSTTPSNAAALTAVQNTCKTGHLWNYSTSTPSDAGTATLATDSTNPNPKNTAGILDYTAIPGAYQVLPSTLKIANESAKVRYNADTTVAQATPIVYSLKITQDGLLSFSYSYNGGTSQPVITSQDITASNGPLPESFRFGFAGSTGGSTNVHEILCFKASPAVTSNSSGGLNVYQNPTVKIGTQLFLAYYFPSDWAGQLTAQSVAFDTTTNSVVVNTTPTWDARCVLTGVNTTTGQCSTGATSMAAEAPASRTLITWDSAAKTGIPLEWGSLSSALQAALDAGDTAPINSKRLAYLRGDRTNEITSTGSGLFRARDSVLGDIINSSPTWVGPPQLPYTSLNTWVDQLHPTAAQPESAGTQTYAAYQSAKQGRTNVVYVGANDGFVHGFRAGTMDANGNLLTTTTLPNDGYEVIAYMPGAALKNIHPVDSTGAVIPQLDFANSQYSHNYFVDATPATGDVFYSGTWHSWLVGGLGAGGAAIYALDITNPDSFSEGSAASIVVGEWTPANLTCVNSAGCNANLGTTFGTPQIRRFHNGQWGAIIGNGYNSTNGTAGIYIMLIDASGKPTFYYLASGSTTKGNGIANPSSADLDLDHIVDYIYAGDLLGNVWRFDVTSTDPANWSTNTTLLFTAAQPITTHLAISTLKTITTSSTLAGTTLSNGPERVVINFGTGRMIPQTLTATTQYATGTQYLYGIWDWNMTAWNTLSPGQQAISLSAPQTITAATLQQQTVTGTFAATTSTAAYRTVSHNTVCWKGSTGCSPTTMLGWYMQLPASNEQVIFDPTLSPDGELVVNTFVPTPDSILSCNAAPATGWSMALQPDTGAGSPTPFFNVNGTITADGVQLNGTGMPSFISSGQAADNNAEYFISQTTNGPAPPVKVNRHVIVTGQRLNWIQRR